MTPPLDPLRAVAEAGRELTSTISLDAALKLIVGSAARLTSAEHAAIVLRGPDGSVTRFSSTHDASVSDDAGSGCEIDAVDVLALLLRDGDDGNPVRSGAASPAQPGDDDGAEAGPAFIGMPIRLHDEPLGAVYLVGKAGGGSFSTYDELIMEHFAHQAALTIGGACLVWQAVERAECLSALSKLTRLIRSTEKVHEVCEAVAKAAVILLGAAVARVWERDEASERLQVRGGYTVDPQFKPALLSEHLGPCTIGLAGEIVTTRRPRFVGELPDAVWASEAPLLEARFGAYAGLPIATARRAFGVLSIVFAQPRRFTPEDKELVALLADSAAIAMEGAHLFEEMQQRRREAELLADIGRTINATLDLDALLPGVAEAARELSGADVVLVALREPGADALHFRYWSGARYRRYDSLRLQPGKALAGHVVATGRPVRSDDVREDPRTDPSHLGIIETEGFRSAMMLPIRIAGRVDGILCVVNRELRPFTDGDEAVLLRLADQAAIAIRNARLFAETERRGRAAEMVADVARLILELAPIDEVATRILEGAQRLLSARSGQLFQIDEESGDLTPLARAGELPSFVRSGIIPRGMGSMGLAILERRTVVVSDLLQDARIEMSPEARAGIAEGFDAAALAAPLVVRDRVIGVLVVRDRTGRVFDADDLRLAEQFAHQAALALDNARLYAEAKQRPPSARSRSERRTAQPRPLRRA